MLANDSSLTPMPGVAFWPFYRARTDTIAHVNELIRHYYHTGRTDYYGDGDYAQLVGNAGFEEDGVWELAGTAEIVNYGSLEEVPNQHEPASHGQRCLRMVRGEAACTARQTLSLEPDTWYTLTAYCLIGSGAGAPLLEALAPGGEPLQAHRGQATWDPWLTPVVTFRTGDAGQATIGLSDDSMSRGATTYWDFVEVEECRGINRPSVIRRASLDNARRRLAIQGQSLMPGSTISIDEGEPSLIEWASPTEAWVTLKEPLPLGRHTLRLRRPY